MFTHQLSQLPHDRIAFPRTKDKTTTVVIFTVILFPERTKYVERSFFFVRYILYFLFKFEIILPVSRSLGFQFWCIYRCSYDYSINICRTPALIIAGIFRYNLKFNQFFVQLLSVRSVTFMLHSFFSHMALSTQGILLQSLYPSRAKRYKNVEKANGSTCRSIPSSLTR